MFHKLLILTIVSFSIFIAACEPDTPAERIADSVEEAGDSLRDSADDIGNEVEDACEEIKEEAGAKDSNC
ncbi:MAG: hypothetical protein HKN35_13280 [Woeseia sp.]|nr:hypothetical protein [Woeseia sp.]NNE61861.1 hypothetical protein [Woeseia sp.]NNL55116.1 hypothetical protein [Woeseia sp.]